MLDPKCRDRRRHVIDTNYPVHFVSHAQAFVEKETFEERRFEPRSANTSRVRVLPTTQLGYIAKW